MTFVKAKCGLIVLQYSLGIVILIQAVMFVLPGAAHDVARTHMPGFVRLVLGFGEIAGCVLLLIPQTAIRGAWLLLAVFVMAILLHMLHGMYGIGGGGIRDCGGEGELSSAFGDWVPSPGCARRTAGGGCPHIRLRP